jgi:hypothetical protein
MKKWLKRLAVVVGAVVLLVTLALGFAVWTTTPPTGYSEHPEGPDAVFAAPEGPISAGAAAVDVTPVGLDVWLGGFGQARKATGVHDPLYARALALQVGDVKVVLVAIDTIGLSSHHAARVRERLAKRLPPLCVLVCATHDHSAPDTLGLWGPNLVSTGVSPAFLEQVLDGAARAAEGALDALRPARLRLSRTRAPSGVSKNKRDPEVIDREILVIAADDANDGKPLATAVVFACHPEVMFGQNTLVTADYPGVLLRAIEKRRGGTGVFLNGPLGGMVTPDVKAHTFEEMDRVGTALADASIAALESATTVDRADLVWVHRSITIPIQNRGFIAFRKLGVFDRPFASGGYVESEVNALKLGPLTLATVPGEALPKLGFEVKPDAPFSAVLALAGDELGYLIPEEAFADEKRYRYEKTVSPGPLATTLIRKTSLEVVARTKR